MIEIGSAAGRGGGPAAHHCPLCGYRFQQGEEHCSACPMSSGCGSERCPRCGYEFLDRSATVDAILRLGRRLQRALGRLRSAREGAAR